MSAKLAAACRSSKAAAKKSQRRDDQHRNELQVLKTIGPDSDDEAKQTERDGSEDEESEHRQGVGDSNETNIRAVINMIKPSRIDLLAAAPT